MPTNMGLGPDAVIVNALVEWPDAVTDAEAALHWHTIEFLIPLPQGTRLVDRINAIAPNLIVRPSPHDIPELLSDL